jgi:hypothetical protein
MNISFFPQINVIFLDIMSEMIGEIWKMLHMLIIHTNGLVVDLYQQQLI